MLFRNESGMHRPIKNYLRKRRGYDVTVEIEKIDVAGIKKKEDFVDVVGVEAKLKLTEWGDACSKAIKAQQKCIKTYVAFPVQEFENKENEEHLKLLHELCDVKGIGILKVRENDCKVDRPPRAALRMDDYKEIIYRIRERVLNDKKSFDGFEEDDFNCFLFCENDIDTDEKRRNRGVAKTKMTYLINGVFEKLKKKFPNEFKGHKVGTLSEHGCWAFISSEKIEKIRPRLKNYIHFSHFIDSTGFYFRIHAEGRYNLSQKMNRPIEMIIKKIEDNPETFVKKLRDCKIDEIKISTRENGRVGTFSTRYPKKYVIKNIKSIANLLRFLVGKYVYFDAQIHYSKFQRVVKSKEMVDKVIELTKETKPFYDFIKS